MLRSLMALILSLTLLAPAFAQSSLDGSGSFAADSPPASILNRQNALREGASPVDPNPDPDSARTIANQLGSGINDAETYRAIRFGTDDVTTSTISPESRVLIQTGGMRWLEVRHGPLLLYGGGALVAMLVVLLLFFLIRGRIRIESGWSGRTMVRFTFIERFAHWMLAGSFIVLGLTGLFLLFGRQYLIPLIGHDAYSVGAAISKWSHNNVSIAFMLALVLIFVFWVWNNIPSPRDWTWIRKGGGLFSKGAHVDAKKFNAGQKVIFWMTIILGVSVSASGLSLLFPFELPLFAKTFAIINATGIPGLFGHTLPMELAPQEEMQLAQLWHSIVAFVMMAVILAHIYIGSIGMQGAFAAMGSGDVDENWAKEHHNLWAEKKLARQGRSGHDPHGSHAPAPAE